VCNRSETFQPPSRQNVAHPVRGTPATVLRGRIRAFGRGFNKLRHHRQAVNYARSVGSQRNPQQEASVSMHHLAQLNIGIIRGPMDSAVMADFAGALERINALAERSPGFIWRLQTAAGDATAIRPTDNPNLLVNMSVWRDLESLRDYVYHTAHVNLMRRRREWFERMPEAFLVLWWIPVGHQPTVAEAMARLELLRSYGPTPAAFSFRQAYPSPGARQGGATAFDEECPAR